MQTELLAPAKNITIAKAAIDAGADAVYIGASDFGARKRAGNSLTDIKELVHYAHKFNVKVMVTVNTIIKDSECASVKALIKNLYDIGVDSIIVQDMAILKWSIEGEIPPIQLHISTQCHNLENDKIHFFREMGISRVVLARELSLSSIKKIIELNPDLEIETFVHGALCVSYSGQCYFSQCIGGRSANRGECAQPCRKKYSVVDDKGNILVKDKHVLSLKDFNTTPYLKDLVGIGVKSFKIEGRLKDVDYVRNVVSYYRNLLDEYSEKTSSGRVITTFVSNIDKTFNRGYTTYFLKEREDCFNLETPKFIGERIGKVVKVDKNSFTVKLNSDIVVHNQDGLNFDKTGEAGCLVNKVINNVIYPNNMPSIKVGQSVYRNVDSEFDKSVLTAKFKRQIGCRVSYSNYKLNAIDEDGNEISLDISERDNPNNFEKNIENFKKSLNKTGESDFYIEDLKILSDLPFMPISKINEYRRILFDKLMAERLKDYVRVEQEPLKYVDYPLKEIDYRGNVYNKEAEEFYNKCNSVVKEYAYEYSVPDREVEIMRTKHCIKYALNMCKADKKLYLIDDRGEKYKLKFDCKNCEMAIIK